MDSNNKASEIKKTMVDTLLTNVPDLVFVKDAEGVYIECNQAFAKFVGKPRSAIVGHTDYELFPENTADFFRNHDLAMMRELSPRRNEELVTYPNGHKVFLDTVKIPFTCSETGDAGVMGISRDISDEKLASEILALRCRLSDMVFQDDKNLILREALDTAERLTFSEIGFFHFFNEDEDTISLQAWSSNTSEIMCCASSHETHYPLSKAGVWVDCVHKKQPVIHNDYESLEHKQGMPEGHPRVVRELTVPLFRKGKIVAVIGLGNKKTEYTDQDVSITEHIANLCFDYSKRIEAENQIKFMAYNDVLTRLPNRQLFSDRLDQAILDSKRSLKTIAVCYLDLDEFKPINDQHGHDMGDRLLIRLAKRLKAELREGDTLARLGGDEFAFILTGLSYISEAEEIVQRILSRCCSPFDIEGHRLIVSASIGITCYPDDSSDTDTLLRNADQAMYQAKKTGKNTYQLFAPIKNQEQIKREKFLNDFEKGLKKDELILHYQPRIDLHTSRLASLEALVRWRHPEQGMLWPDKFLPQIQGTRFEIMLDEWVLTKALDQHLSWKALGLIVPVSVNISPRHLQQSSFPDDLRKLLKKYPDGIAAFLELEVLEIAGINDISHVSSIMKECTAQGVSFSLDDFGTGYSSLTYFCSLPIKTLKIDKSFVMNMLNNGDDKQIVEGVIRLASSLKRPVVAEGVENDRLAQLLVELGCKYAQGFGIAKPMAPNELLDWVNQQQLV